MERTLLSAAFEFGALDVVLSVSNESSIKSSQRRRTECPPHTEEMPDNYVAIASAARTSVVDAAALDQALRRHVRGDVRFDSSSRALYATDGSNYRQVPDRRSSSPRRR